MFSGQLFVILAILFPQFVLDCPDEHLKNAIFLWGGIWVNIVRAQGEQVDPLFDVSSSHSVFSLDLTDKPTTRGGALLYSVVLCGVEVHSIVCSV